MSKKNKKSQKLMRVCMLLFAIVIVFVSAAQGTVFKQFKDAKAEYNQNVFYVYTDNFSVGDKLIAATGSHGIDYTRISEYYYGDRYLSFSPVQFETYSQGLFSFGLYSNGVILPYSMCEGMKVVAGSGDAPSDKEIIISTATADRLLERSTFGFVEDYSDIIGFLCSLDSGNKAIVKGVVETDETAAYVSEAMAEKTVYLWNLGLHVDKCDSYGVQVEDGKTVIYVLDGADRDYPEIGEKVMISGREYEVANIVESITSYDEYLRALGKTDVITKFENHYNDCHQKVKAENPSADETEVERLAQELFDKTYYEAYAEYYAYVGDYISVGVNKGGYYGWVYRNYGHESAKYLAIGDIQMAMVEHYREKNGGEYLSLSEADMLLFSGDSDYKTTVYDEFEVYMTEYKFSEDSENYVNFYDYTYLLSDGDYYKSTLALGTSDKTVIETNRDDMDFNYSFYTLVHSTDYEATKAYLEAEFSDIKSEYGEPTLVTPDTMLEMALKNNRESMIASIVTLVVFVAVLSLCVYFIMRSALMGRVKEIGIYRAIGVSKNNLIFRFLIETIVLTTLTVFIGYFISSFVITNWLLSSSIMAQVFYFPIWLSVLVLILLYGVCTVSGILPILTLLRKTPSEILAKYDI